MIEVDIVTPQRELVSRAQVSSVKLPAVAGEMEVLPQHTPVVALLGTGIISFNDNGKDRRFAISEGIAEVQPNKVVVLAETCEESHEIDRDRVLQAIERSQQGMNNLMTREDFARLEKKLNRARARQKAME